MNPSSPITVKDLARICGVSIGTVDRAINDRKGISPDTKKRILATAEQYGFVKNQNALTLSSGKSRNIGVIIFSLGNEYFTTLLTAIEKEARECGYATIIMMSNYSAESEIECARKMYAMNVAGLIVFSVLESAEFYTSFIRAGIPVVSVGNRLKEHRNIRIPFAGIDDYSAMKASTEYVISRGYRKLIYVAPVLEKGSTQNISAQTLRYEGFLDTVRSRGVNYDVIADYSAYGSSFLQLEPQRAERTALLCPSDSYTLKCLSVHWISRSPENRFGIMGFDRFPTVSAILPRLSGISYSTEEIGIRAARLLFEENPEDAIIPYEIVEGETL